MMLSWGLSICMLMQQPLAFRGSVVDLIKTASPLVKGVLLILLLFSIVSWTIMADKYRLIKRAKRQSRSFLQIFRKSGKFSEVNAVCQNLKHSPLVGLFLAAFNELNYQLRTSYLKANPERIESSVKPKKMSVYNLDSINRALQRASMVEVNKLERSLNFLATTASVSPFIGLFGTVMGIVSAFQAIGLRGTANLAMVAPGISEALVATAGGLLAAIPAVIGYNHFLNKIKILASEMDDFSSEFISITERNFT
ncbi:MAG: MotA/TolQ/ExbB proton channel family protein [Acidobacteriota bacterium]